MFFELPLFDLHHSILVIEEKSVIPVFQRKLIEKSVIPVFYKENQLSCISPCIHSFYPPPRFRGGLGIFEKSFKGGLSSADFLGGGSAFKGGSSYLRGGFKFL